MAQFGLNSIGQIGIVVRDLEESLAFYRESLGLPFLFEAPPKMAFFRCGDVMLLLGEATDGAPPASSILYFQVEDIAAAHQALVARGVRFRNEPHLIHREPARELWQAEFEDPDGNTHAIRTWKATT